MKQCRLCDENVWLLCERCGLCEECHEHEMVVPLAELRKRQASEQGDE